MKVSYIAETLHSNKQNKDFYILRMVLLDGADVVAKSQPIIWLTEEQYKKFTSK